MTDEELAAMAALDRRVTMLEQFAELVVAQPPTAAPISPGCSSPTVVMAFPSGREAVRPGV